MFNDIFGGGGRRRRAGGRAAAAARRARLRPRNRGHRLPQADVLTGCDRDVEFTDSTSARRARARRQARAPSPITCNTCGGQGKVVIQSGLGGMFRMVRLPGLRRHGQVRQGQVPRLPRQGAHPSLPHAEVKIPAGIREGQAVRVQGEGEPPAQQMIARRLGRPRATCTWWSVEEHEIFQREGDHLMMEMPISYTQAALGAHLEVPTLDEPASIAIDRAPSTARSTASRARACPTCAPDDAATSSASSRSKSPKSSPPNRKSSSASSRKRRASRDSSPSATASGARSGNSSGAANQPHTQGVIHHDQRNNNTNRNERERTPRSPPRAEGPARGHRARDGPDPGADGRRAGRRATSQPRRPTPPRLRAEVEAWKGKYQRAAGRLPELPAPRREERGRGRASRASSASANRCCPSWTTSTSPSRGIPRSSPSSPSSRASSSRATSCSTPLPSRA